MAVIKGVSLRILELVFFAKIEKIMHGLQDIHRESTLTGKTQAPRKSMNMNIWVIGTLN